MNEEKVITVPVSNLIPGMVAARDVYSRNDRLLIPKDSEINDKTITRITFMGIMSVPVYDNDMVEMPLEDDELENEYMSPEEKQEFVEFKENYDLTANNVMKNMNQLLKADGEIDQARLVEDVDKLVFKSRSKYHIFDMLHNIKRFDDETYRHCLNVAMINNVFADWLGMNEHEKNQLTLCGLLHDVGKLLINKEVLRKPDRLTEDEYEEIRQHPMRGYQSLKDKKIPESVKRAVLLHHERCDGKGYPFGFTTSEIDPYAAITAIADVYEAMTATRVYRKGMSPFDVIRIFEEDGKKQFNPIFLVPLLNNMTNTYLQHEVVLSNGKTGKIVLINKNELSRPTILLDDGTLFDLSKEREVNITEVH
ncbi:MAG: HD-GYP domain-containing protein [Roseburia sp.]|nr:HD-GYP domain-containing protein [Roseburia sp.]